MQKLPPPSPYLLTGASKMHVKNRTTILHFRPESRKKNTTAKGVAPLSADPIKLSVLFGSLGAPSGALLLCGFAFFASAGNLLDHSLLWGVHQHSDLWLLLATFVLTACYSDLKPGVHQHSDFGLLLATIVITTCYADLKPGVRI